MPQHPIGQNRLLPHSYTILNQESYASRVEFKLNSMTKTKIPAETLKFPLAVVPPIKPKHKKTHSLFLKFIIPALVALPFLMSIYVYSIKSYIFFGDVIILYLLPISIAAYVFGYRAGVGVVALSLLSLIGLLLYPTFSFTLFTLFMLIPLILLTLTGIVVSFLIGRRKRITEEIILEKERRTAIVESLFDGVVLINSRGKIVEVNHAIENLLGYKKKECVGKKFGELFISSSEKQKRALISHLIADAHLTSGRKMQVTAIKKDKNEMPIELSITNIQLAKEKLFACFIRDITAEKKQEMEFYQVLLNEQRALTRAEEAISARDEFLSIASHELKTPLTAMLLQLQNVLHNIRSVSLANFSITNLLNMLENTEAQSKRLARMINDLLNISLITTGRLDLELENFDLVAAAHDIVNRFADRLKRENYTVKIIAPKPVIGTWDKLRIEQIIMNLLSNAIKYGNKQPIKITIKKEEDHAVFGMEDHGIGIPAEKREKIFSRFHRAVSPKEYKGLGIGLYITSQLVKSHHGTISVESEAEKGSIFTITLPLQVMKKGKSLKKIIPAAAGKKL